MLEPVAMFAFLVETPPLNTIFNYFMSVFKMSIEYRYIFLNTYNFAFREF